MNRAPTKTELDAVISSIASDLREQVAKIESRTATTKNHYGDYLGILTVLSRGERRIGKIIVAALLEAGANHGGVASAYKITFGE